MKKEYSKPEIDITEFECEDIITASNSNSRIIEPSENECEIILNY